MATHIGPAFEGSQFVSGVPLDIIMKGAMMKDAKIEQNITQFKDEFRTIASQPIENEESAKYIKEKLGQAVENVKNFVNQGGIDFSQQESMSSLRGSVNDVISDPEFMRRYKNDIEASGKRRQVETLKQIGSEKFSNENYAVFMKHYQDYVKDPNGSRMDYSYVEYDNYNERLNSAIKDLKPETRIRQVVRKVNGMDVIENVTEKFYDPNRVQQVITNTLGDKGIAQLKANYDYQMMTSSDESVKEYFVGSKNIMVDHINTLLKQRMEYENLKSSNLTDEQKKILDEKILQLEDRIKKESEPLFKVDEVLRGHDGSDDYFKKKFEFNTFLSNKIKGLVSQHAIIEDMKVEIDPLSMEAVKWYYKAQEKDLDFQYKKKELEITNNHAMQLKQFEAILKGEVGMYGSGVAGDGSIPFDSQYRTQDEFRDAYVNLFMSNNGEYQMPTDIAGYGLSGGQKPNGDGSYNVSISKDNSFTAIGDVSSSAFGKGLTPQKVADLTINQKYEKVLQEFAEKNRSWGESLLSVGVDALSLGGGRTIIDYIRKTQSSKIKPIILGDYGENVKNQYFNETLGAFKKSKEFINFLKETGHINKDGKLVKDFIYNPNWENDIKKSTSFKHKESIDMLISNKFTDLGHAGFHVSNEKGNVIRTNNAKAYTKGYVNVSRTHLESIGFNDNIIEDFTQSGILRRTKAANKKDGEGNANDEYQLKLYVELPTELGSSRDMYYRDKLGDEAFKEKAGRSRIEFDKAMEAVQGIKQLGMGNADEKIKNINDNIDKLEGDVITKEQADAARQKITKFAEILNSENASVWQKLDAGQMLSKLSLGADRNIDEVRNFVSNATGGVKYSSTVVKGTPLTVDQIQQNLTKQPTLVSGVNSYIVSQPISVQHNFGNNHNLIASFLDAITSVEGGEYDIGYRGTKFSGFAKHPGDLVRQEILNGPNKGKFSDAAGKYQFLSATYNPIAKSIGLNDFSPASQDRAAWELVKMANITNEQKLIEASHTGYLNISKEVLGGKWEGVKIKPDDFIKFFKNRTGITIRLI